MQGSLNSIEEWEENTQGKRNLQTHQVTYMIEKGMSKRAEKRSQKEDKMYPGK